MASRFETTATVFGKESKTILLSCATIYIVLQILVGVNFNSQNPICNDSHKLSDWANTMNFIVCVCFTLSSFHIILKILTNQNSRFSESYSYMSANLLVNIISGSSTFLTLRFGYGGLCRNGFG